MIVENILCILCISVVTITMMMMMMGVCVSVIRLVWRWASVRLSTIMDTIFNSLKMMAHCCCNSAEKQ